MRYTIVSEVSFKADVGVRGAQLQISNWDLSEREGTYLFKQNETKLICSKSVQR